MKRFKKRKKTDVCTSVFCKPAAVPAAAAVTEPRLSPAASFIFCKPCLSPIGFMVQFSVLILYNRFHMMSRDFFGKEHWFFLRDYVMMQENIWKG